MGWLRKVSEWQPLRRLIATLLAVAAVWLLFRVVIGDPRLFLDYLKVLAWPMVAVAFLSFFRAPLEDRFRHLLRIEALGASAEFSEVQGRRLQHDLEGDVDNLLGEIGQRDDDSEQEVEPGEAVPDVEQPSVNEEATNSEADAVAQQPDEAGGAHNNEDDEQLAAEVLAEMVEVARAFGVPAAVVDGALVRSEGDLTAQRQAVRRILRNEAAKARQLRKMASHRPQETRESIEAVIQKSASWGYDMGKAGAPKAVPDVEWNEDGTWRITTAVPAAKSAPREPNSSQDAQDRARHIKALEDEIKDIERARHSSMLGPALAFSDDKWLRELRRRLRRIDPGNPWAAGRDSAGSHLV